MTDVLLPTDPIKLKRFHQNHKAYNANKAVYKVYYLMNSYPHLKLNHSVDIANYFNINGPTIDDNFIIFLKSFIVKKPRPTVYKEKPLGPKRLPKMLRNIVINSTNESDNEDSNSSEDC